MEKELFFFPPLALTVAKGLGNLLPLFSRASEAFRLRVSDFLRLHGTGVVPASQEGDLPGMWDDDGRVLDPRLYWGGRGPSWHVG